MSAVGGIGKANRADNQWFGCKEIIFAMSGISIQQQRFWGELTMLRAQIEYLSLYEVQSERYDHSIKIFLAIASSSSIAAWAVWREFAMLWGSIIAISQFIGAIKDLLPFEKRLKAARELGGKLESLYVQWESSWNAVANGELTEGEINTRLSELKKAKAELTFACLNGATLPDRPALHERAAACAKKYFEIVYPIGGRDEREGETR